MEHDDLVTMHLHISVNTGTYAIGGAISGIGYAYYRGYIY